MDDHGISSLGGPMSPSVPIDPEELQTVWRWVDSLRADSPIRLAATKVITQTILTNEDFEQCLSAFHPGVRQPWQQRIVATWILGRCRLRDDQLPRVVAELIALVRYGANGRYWDPSNGMGTVGRRPQSSVGIAVVITFCILWLHPSVVALPAVVTIILLSRSKAKARVARRSTQVEAIRAMGRIGSFQFLDELSEQACNARTFRVRQLASAALYRPLASITANHYGLVPRTTMANLTRILRFADPPLAVVILRAMCFIGDESCLGTINALAAGWLPSTKTAGVQAAAIEAQQAISGRIERSKEPRQLLRASGEPIAQDESLLRAAGSSGPAHDPASLLRSVTGSTDDSHSLTLDILADLAKKGTPDAIAHLEKLANMPDASIEVRTAAQNLLATARATSELNTAAPIRYVGDW